MAIDDYVPDPVLTLLHEVKHSLKLLSLIIFGTFVCSAQTAHYLVFALMRIGFAAL